MKLVTAVVNPDKVTDVKEAVDDLGVHRMTTGEVRGHGRQRGHREVYRGAEHRGTRQTCAVIRRWRLFHSRCADV